MGVHANLQDGVHGPVAGILRAYDAETLREIWNSEQNAARDRIGTLMKFVPPVVVNGKVYMPNHDGAVAVYGLLPAPVARLQSLRSVHPRGRSHRASPARSQWRSRRSGGFGESVAPQRGGPTARHDDLFRSVIDHRRRDILDDGGFVAARRG